MGAPYALDLRSAPYACILRRDLALPFEMSGCSLRIAVYAVRLTLVLEMSGCSLRIALEEVFLYGTVIYAVHITLVSEKMGCYVGIAPDAVLLTQCALRLQVK